MVMWKWEADGDAKAVIVMIHGALEHHRRYGWLIEAWRSSGFHVLMGDLPGHGMTTRASRGHIDTFDDYILEVKEWVEAAYEFDLPVFLLGHSMGGLVAIRMLQEERVEIAGLILSSPCLGLINYPSKMLDMLSHGLNVLVPAMRMSPGLTVEMATRNEDVRAVDANDSLYLTKVSIRWYRELIAAMEQAFENMGKVQDVPTLLVQGGDDRIVDKRSVKEWFNNAPLSEKRYKEWPNCYHEVFNEPEREEVFDYAHDFVISQLKAIGYVY